MKKPEKNVKKKENEKLEEIRKTQNSSRLAEVTPLRDGKQSCDV